MKTLKQKRWAIRAGALAVGLFAVVVGLRLAFPLDAGSLDRLPRSPVVLDCEGRPLLWRVGVDDQWRVPVPLEKISPWLRQATVAVEDERFFSHPGVDPLAVTRAMIQNLEAGRVVSGASTLTMQVCKMMGNRPRTFSAKCVEAFQALQLEGLQSKDGILETYLNMAPYGGNLRGVEAAARQYFGVPSGRLTLGEAALLAGLPNSPERLRPDRHLEKARERRGTVLRRMCEEGMITRDEEERAAAEPVALGEGRCRFGPLFPSHGAWWALQRRPEGGRTFLNLDLVKDVERLLHEEAPHLIEGGQIAAVLIEIETGGVRALCGSVDVTDPRDGQVNGALAWRSPGSALKPFIYGAAFEVGRLAPESKVYDIPIEREGWSPGNFDGTFSGEVLAADALRRSLNVPPVLVAEGVGLDRCVGYMEGAGISFRGDPASRGGLAVVVGAVEVRLVDLVNAYATIGRGGVFAEVRLFVDEPGQEVRVMKPAVCRALDEILSSRARAPRGMEGRAPCDRPWFMWKTGTSSGRRDAWAVGHNLRYAAGVWVGRFSGAGDESFVGALVAEPILARIFDLPRIRNRVAPDPGEPLAVASPLPPPPETGAGGLKILFPEEGAIFKALSGSAKIRAAANRAGTVTWFLNGRKCEPPFLVPPGSYELRCLELDGTFASTRFTVE